MTRKKIPKMKDSEKNDKKSNRIGRIAEETLSYYRQVSLTSKEGFENDQHKELFMNNVFTQLSQEALEVSRNQTVSFIIEDLLQSANRNQLQQFIAAFSADWEVSCGDRFASYVTQTLLTRCAPYVHSGSDDDQEQESGKTIKDMFTACYHYLTSNLAFHMQHTYASHVIRVCLEVLAGVKVCDRIIRGKVAKKQDPKKQTEKKLPKPSPDNLQLLFETCDRIFSLPKLEDHAKNCLSNPVLQTAMLVLQVRSPERCIVVCRDMMSQILQTSESQKQSDDIALPEVVTHTMGTRLLEQIFAVIPEDVFDETLKAHFLGKLLHLGIHPLANYVLQKLIAACHTKDQFELIFAELRPSLEDILAQDHLGLVVRLAEGALKHSTKQRKLVKALMKAFHCYTPEERQTKCVPLFASITTYDVFYKVQESNIKEGNADTQDKATETPSPILSRINYHGSLLLQTLLNFGDPRLLVTSLLQMTPLEICRMSCDPCGSHVIEVFVTNETIGEKSRDNLYKQLQGFYIELACNRNGSRTLDCLWNSAQLKHKFAITEELVKHQTKLQGDVYGRFIWRKYGLQHFMNRPKEWKEIQSGHIKKRQLFQDIIDDKTETVKQKHSKKRKKVRQQESEEGNSVLLEDETDTPEVLDTVFSGKANPDSKFKISEDPPESQATGKKNKRRLEKGKDKKSVKKKSKTKRFHKNAN